MVIVLIIGAAFVILPLLGYVLFTQTHDYINSDSSNLETTESGRRAKKIVENHHHTHNHLHVSKEDLVDMIGESKEEMI